MEIDFDELLGSDFFETTAWIGAEPDMAAPEDDEEIDDDREIIAAGNAFDQEAPENPELAAAAELIALAGVADREPLADELRRILSLDLSGQADADELRRMLQDFRDTALVNAIGKTANAEDAWQRFLAAAFVEGLGEAGAGVGE